MRHRPIPRAFSWVLAALSLVATAPVACSGNDTGTGGTGGGTGTTTSGESSSTGATGCDACTANEVCVDGACQPISNKCPCGVETYCDVPTDTCKTGCLSQADCGPGRVCNVDTKACFDGCLSSAECPSGKSCVNHQCLEGCGTTADCLAPGTVCVEGHCGCPAGEGLCNGACTLLSSPSNCGACGVKCQGAETCNGTSCVCAPGVCAPETLVPPGGGPAYQLQLDGTYLYFNAPKGLNASGIFRRPKNGGATEQVTAKIADSFAVGGGFVIYTVLTDGNTHAYNLMKVPVAGGVDVKIDAGPQATPYFTADAGAAYWYRSDKWYAVELAVTAANPLVDLMQPTGGVVTNKDGLYWVSCTGPTALNCHVYRYFLGTTTNLDQTGFNGFADDTDGLFVDATDAYLSMSAPKKQIVRMPITGGVPVTVAATANHALYFQGDGANFYWYEAGNPIQGIPAFIRRVPKAGGAVTDFATLAPEDQVTSIAVDTDYVYWTRFDGAILRFAK